MFIVAMFLISAGYTFAYWGINNLISWEPQGSTKDSYGNPGDYLQTSSLGHGTTAVELSILSGVKKEVTASDIMTDNGKTMQNRHKVPFPYRVVLKSGKVQPIDNPTGTPANPVVPV